MKVQYASDIHLEFIDNAIFIARGPFKPVGDVLLLAGDTLPLKEINGYKQHRFFDWCAEHYVQTLLIPGNHEYYHDNLDRYPDSFELELRPNVKIYENRTVVIDDTEFILSTLWSHIPDKDWPALRDGMNDFHIIKIGEQLLMASDYNRMHERDLAFIKKAVETSKAAHKVVVTHHVPSRLCVAPEFKNSTLECGFTVDLTDYIESSGIDAWIYGHSHRSIDCTIGKTKVISNQVGYVAYKKENVNFRGDACLQLSPAALP